MAITNAARFERLEQTCMRYILKTEMLEKELDKLKSENERLRIRIERQEAGGTTIVPIIRLCDLERAR